MAENKRKKTPNRSSVKPKKPVVHHVPFIDLDEEVKAPRKPASGAGKWQQFKNFSNQTKNDAIKKIRKMREERLTVMFIPHNEKSIRNFHITNFTLNIVLAISAVVILVSAVLIVRHNSTVQEVDKLKLSQKDAQIQFARIREEIRDIGKSYGKFREHISELSGLVKGKTISDDSLFAAGGVNLPEENHIIEDETDIQKAEKIPLEMFLLNRIHHEMQVAQVPLGNMQGYLKKREKIIRNSPTLWPTRGYILNPFGYVRSGDRLRAVFNRGIDIVTMPGAAVNATAPGVVVSVQRNARFIYTVRVRHNYGFETVYEGLERVTVARNEKISKGESIGYVGHFRDSPEHILHYEIHIGIEPVDPMPYLSVLKY